jgi:hypothetical protein
MGIHATLASERAVDPVRPAPAWSLAYPEWASPPGLAQAGSSALPDLARAEWWGLPRPPGVRDSAAACPGLGWAQVESMAFQDSGSAQAGSWVCLDSAFLAPGTATAWDVADALDY